MRVAVQGRRIVLVVVTALALLVAAPAYATLTLTPVYSGLSMPMYVTSPPGDSHRLLIVERGGVIRIAVDGVLQATPFLTIPNVWTSGEAGLISIAFDPNYATNGHFYAYYVTPPASGQSGGPIHVDEFTASPPSSNVANPTGRPVLTIPHPDASNHYGGTMHFGPDGYLYFGVGDGGGANNQFGNAQDTKKSLLGKLMRIDPHAAGANPYSIPAGNPFAGQPLCDPPSGTTNCPEILAWGLRNPFRWSFDDATGNLVIGDVGQGGYEEIDYVPQGAQLAGDNFGWPCYEGPTAYQTSQSPCPALQQSALTFPVGGYSHSAPGLGSSIAITGGLVVRDPAVPSLAGLYLYADFYAGVIHSLQLATPSASGDQVVAGLPQVPELVSFGEGGDGHIYVVSLGATASSGAIFRLDDSSAGSSPPAPPGSNGGQSSAGGTGQPPPAAPAARDTTPPRLSLRVARRQNVLKRGLVRLSIACDEPCIVRASGRARGGALRGELRHLAAGKRATLVLRAPRLLLRRLARSGVVVVTVRARDAAGNLATRSLTVAVVRG